ncbi:MAG: L-fucose mutarotase [Bacteroidaceae bacterium]|nr:L-fucose mutarotase [Bacteroidaceae bacterium]
MLKGISPLLSPELLKILCEMGHGDEIVLSDAHFPAHTLGVSHVVRADGLKVTQLLRAILPLFELDAYVEHPLITMSPVPGDTLDPSVEASYLEAIHETNPQIVDFGREERFAFYERARKAYAVVVTGETAKYGNIILKKGVTPIND